jgi:hypothetical protein
VARHFGAHIPHRTMVSAKRETKLAALKNGITRNMMREK